MKSTLSQLAGLLAALSLVALAGCQSSQPAPPTAPVTAGRPQVTIAGSNVESIQRTLRDFFLGRGYQERRSDHTNKLTFDKAHQQRSDDSPATKALRIRVTVTPRLDGTCEIEAMPYVVEAWRRALESDYVELSGFPQVQYFLEQIKAAIEAGK
jgi:hypothetical protein